MRAVRSAVVFGTGCTQRIDGDRDSKSLKLGSSLLARVIGAGGPTAWAAIISGRARHAMHAVACGALLRKSTTSRAPPI